VFILHSSLISEIIHSDFRDTRLAFAFQLCNPDIASMISPESWDPFTTFLFGPVKNSYTEWNRLTILKTFTLIAHFMAVKPLNWIQKRLITTAAVD
jgi:hypothetical protein